MIVTLTPGADPALVRRALAEQGLWAQAVDQAPGGEGARAFVIDAHSSAASAAAILAISGVAGVAAPRSPHPLVDAQPAIVDVGGVAIGPGATPVVMAGPCGVESEAQISRLAAALGPIGVTFLRGGAFKPRTSPYSFQGHGEPALRWMRRAADANGLKVVTEALGAEEAALVAEYADLVQVGSRNMHNYALLRTVAATTRPILLKRGMAATVDEWLCAGEYCLLHGARAVIFCERGIRGFDPTTRNVLDLGAVALLAGVHRVPVVVDPSHGAGRRDLVAPLARAALAAGAAGLLIETHDDPGGALSDGPQALSPAALAAITAGITNEVRHAGTV